MRRAVSSTFTWTRRNFPSRSGLEGTKPEHILIAQLAANQAANLRQIAEIVYREMAATGVFGDVRKQLRTVRFFFWQMGRKGVENADGVDLNVGLPDGGANLALGIAALIVAAIGENHHRLAGIASATLHFNQPQMDGIEQGCATFSPHFAELTLDLAGLFGEGYNQFGSAVEDDQGKLVVGVGLMQQLMEGPVSRPQFAAHTIAGVKGDCDGDGGVLSGEMSNFLFHAVFKDMKLALRQAWNWYSESIGDIGIHEDQGNVDAQVDMELGSALRDALSSKGQRNNGESGDSDPNGIHETLQTAQQEEYNTSLVRVGRNYRCSPY